MSDSVKTLLMVEDEEAILMLGSRILEREGYNVLKANSAATALDLFTRHSSEIQAVLTDYSLQQTTGRMLIRQLREQGFTGPAAYLSGFESDDIISEGDRISAFIQKPFTMESLIGSVRGLFEEV